MRVFDDPQGERWEAALLELSYGEYLLVFGALAGRTIRHKVLYADNIVEAERQLAGFEEDALRGMLAEAELWEGKISQRR